MNVSQNVELYSHLFSDQVIQGVRKKGGFIWGHFSDISDNGGHLVNIDETSGAREVARVYDLKRARLKCSLPTTEREIKCLHSNDSAASPYWLSKTLPQYLGFEYRTRTVSFLRL